MREATGGAWLFGLIITFMFLFVAFLTVMINYSTAFKTKNEIVSIIEEYEGLSSGDASSIAIINKYLRNIGYSATGSCETGWNGAVDLSETDKLESSPQNAYYCVKPTFTNDNEGYYEVQLFINFDIPVFGRIATIRVKGETIIIKYLVKEGLN